MESASPQPANSQPASPQSADPQPADSQPGLALSSRAAGELLLRLDGLLLYRGVMAAPGLVAWRSLLQLGIQPPSPAEDWPGALLRAYGHWFETLAVIGLDWASYVIEQVLLADNPWTQRLARAEVERLDDALRHYDLGGMAVAARQDLATLQQLCGWGGAGAQPVGDRTSGGGDRPGQ